MHQKMKVLTFSSLCVAIATVLSVVKLFDMPQGGTVSACSMFMISVVGYWFGAGAGITAGVAHGILQLILEPYVVHPAQLLLDYPLAFGALGLSGLLRKRKLGLYTGYVLGCMGRWFCSFLSGFIFFSDYAAEGMHPVLYSAVYNFSYILPEMAITMVLISVPSLRRVIEGVGKPVEQRV